MVRQRWIGSEITALRSRVMPLHPGYSEMLRRRDNHHAESVLGDLLSLHLESRETGLSGSPQGAGGRRRARPAHHRGAGIAQSRRVAADLISRNSIAYMAVFGQSLGAI